MHPAHSSLHGGRGVGPTSRSPGRRFGTVLPLVTVLVLVVASCTSSGETTARKDLQGAHLEVMAVWTGTEQQRIEEVLDEFERETGVTITYTPDDQIARALEERLAAGNAPDVAFVPQPGLLRQFARGGQLVPLDAGVSRAVDSNYPAVWRDLGSVDGRLYGVWFKAANKSLVWYDVASFERAGVVPPADLESFVTVAHKIAATGTPAFDLGAADGWTLTDWFENVYLRTAGATDYDLLAAHRLPWTDDTVKSALRILSVLWAPGLVAGGSTQALATTFEASVADAFTSPAHAAMVMEGDFVQGLVAPRPGSRLGVDVDVFAFPSRTGGAPAVMGGGDSAVIMRDSPAAQALLEFLATPPAAAIWAAHGGFVSPNAKVDPAVYPDDTSRSIARRLVAAGDDFRFDLSDLQPAAFGGVEGQGLRGDLQKFLETGNVDATVTRLEADATAAYGGG